MLARRPFGSDAAALDAADRIWVSLFPVDWREAFSRHSRPDDPTERGYPRDAMAEARRVYEERFGYCYVACPSDQDAREVLDLCRRRLEHDPVAELAVSAEEQRKITRQCLERLFAT